MKQDTKQKHVAVKPPAPLAGVVHTIFAAAKTVHDAQPVKPIDRRAVDMTSALTHAAKAISQIDKKVEAPRASPLQRVLAGIGLAASKAKPARAKWGEPKLRALDAKRIEDVLKATTTGAPMMSLDDVVKAEQQAINEGAHCTLPDGATDPICEPR